MVDKLVNSRANSERIANVEQCFGSAGQPLDLPGRVLVGEGVLTKICRKKPKPRQFFLFNDIIVYGTILINKKKYSQQHILELEKVEVQPLGDNGNLRNGFAINSPKKSFQVYAATASEKNEWIFHMERFIKEERKKKGMELSSDAAPVWKPDSASSICMLCHKSKFTFTNRRHHCRKCGDVVCGDCSKKKILLTDQSSKPLRVCDKCFTGASLPAQQHGGSDATTGDDDDSSGDESSDEDEPADQASPPDVTTDPTFYQETEVEPQAPETAASGDS